MLDMGNLHEGKKTYVRTRALKTGGRHLLVNEGVQFWDFTVMLLLTLGCVTFYTRLCDTLCTTYNCLFSLFQVTTREERLSLQIVTYIGGCVSLICLLLTILSFIIFG